MALNNLNNERELLARIAEGDEAAFSVLYRHYARRMFPFLFKMTGSEDAAEDVIQNTFLSLWLNRVHLAELENFGGYIFRTAGNHAYNLLARNLNTKKRETIAAGEAPGPQDTTSQEVLFKEAQKLVNQAVSELPEQRKKIFRLYREERLSYNEIAERLNISPSTVRNSMAAALESIRKKLAALGLSLFFILFFCSQ